MNITLSVDDQIVELAREVARRQGTSLNAMVRQFIEGIAGRRSGEQLAAELEALWSRDSGHSRGQRWTREDAYSGRV